ncbi:unnamed protein product [Effrenium voratum]|uniref:Uncharacterized protein n=1 Tax=Effrenium voratum TaxID=2562239 RepID=A0AA36N690_9DINO|nr:unnamed protein product [Effrenium voratum]
MLQYMPGFGRVTAGDSDDGSPVNDFADEPAGPNPLRGIPMSIRPLSPRTAARCAARAAEASPSPSSSSVAQSRSLAGSSPQMFGSPRSASPTQHLTAERLYWAEIFEREIQGLRQVLEEKTEGCVATVEKMRGEILNSVQEEVASATDSFAALLSSLEERVRREQQASFQAAMEAARQEFSPQSSPRHDVPAQQPATPEASLERSKLRKLDGLVEELSLRVDGLHVKLEEQLTAALAEERKTRGKAISDVCQYVEHYVALQETDAKTEKWRTDNAVAGLEDRVQVLETALGNYLFPASSAAPALNARSDLRSSTGAPGSDKHFPSSTGRSSESTSPRTWPNFRHDAGQRDPRESQPSSSGVGLPLFSEEMKESLKHIVRKVGNTMSTERNGGSASLPSAGAAAAETPYRPEGGTEPPMWHAPDGTRQ